MSEHEIEDLISQSIVVLDAHYGGDERLRDWFARLWKFQNTRDCGFTQFRVMDILLRHGYTYRFPVNQHPDYAILRDILDSLTRFTALRPQEEPDEDDDDVFDDPNWLQDGYFAPKPPFIYCDAGTALWRRLVDDGRLTGRDATAPRRASLLEVVHAVITAAEHRDDAQELIAMWFNFGPHALRESRWCPLTTDEVPATVLEIRQIVERTNALSIPLDYDDRPSEKLLEFLCDCDRDWWSFNGVPAARVM